MRGKNTIWYAMGYKYHMAGKYVMWRIGDRTSKPSNEVLPNICPNIECGPKVSVHETPISLCH